jgi:hypothetical protein
MAGYKASLMGFALVMLGVISQPLVAIDMTSQEDIERVNETFETLVNENGNIHLPENYRQNWGHLGSWTVLNESAPGHGFHDVYTQKEAINAYRENGQFPDGSVLVKEVRKIESGAQTTGHAQWAGDLKITFVMIKDDQGRFPDNKHWQEGWGWMLYEAQNPLKNVSEGFKQTCFACHAPAKQTDWVFVNGYPSLK